jgi:hypothetical protein
MIADLNPLLRGWAEYFGFSQLHELSSLDGWTRRRLRCVVWVGRCGHLQPEATMAAEFVKRATPRPHQQALQGSWAVFHGSDGRCSIRRTAAVRTRMPGGVGRVALRDAPRSRLTAAIAFAAHHDRSRSRWNCRPSSERMGRNSAETPLQQPYLVADTVGPVRSGAAVEPKSIHLLPRASPSSRFRALVLVMVKDDAKLHGSRGTHQPVI